MPFSLRKENYKSEVRQRENPISKSPMRKVGLSLRAATPDGLGRSLKARLVLVSTAEARDVGASDTERSLTLNVSGFLPHYTAVQIPFMLFISHYLHDSSLHRHIVSLLP